jgi:hypothetical protein
VPGAGARPAVPEAAGHHGAHASPDEAELWTGAAGVDGGRPPVAPSP